MKNVQQDYYKEIHKQLFENVTTPDMFYLYTYTKQSFISFYNLKYFNLKYNTISEMAF